MFLTDLKIKEYSNYNYLFVFLVFFFCTWFLLEKNFFLKSFLFFWNILLFFFFIIYYFFLFLEVYFFYYNYCDLLLLLIFFCYFTKFFFRYSYHFIFKFNSVLMIDFLNINLFFFRVILFIVIFFNLQILFSFTYFNYYLNCFFFFFNYPFLLNLPHFIITFITKGQDNSIYWFVIEYLLFLKVDFENSLHILNSSFFSFSSTSFLRFLILFSAERLFVYLLFLHKRDKFFLTIIQLFFLNIFILSHVFLISAYTHLSLFISLELIGLSSCFLIYLTKKNSILYTKAALNYFIVNIFGTFFILLGLLFFVKIYGNTFFFENLINELFLLSVLKSTIFINLDLILGYFFFILGFFIKLGVFPFFFWVVQIYRILPRYLLYLFVLLPKVSLIYLMFDLLSLWGLLYSLGFYTYIVFVFIFIFIINLVFGIYFSLFAVDIKDVLIGSSFVSTSILLILSFFSYKISDLIFFIYYFYLFHYFLTFILVFNFIFYYKLTKIIKIFDYHYNKHQIYLFLFLILSLVGFPMTPGFFLKLCVLFSIILSLKSFIFFYIFLFFLIILGLIYLMVLNKMTFSLYEFNHFFFSIYEKNFITFYHANKISFLKQVTNLFFFDLSKKNTIWFYTKIKLTDHKKLFAKNFLNLVSNFSMYNLKNSLNFPIFLLNQTFYNSIRVIFPSFNLLLFFYFYFFFVLIIKFWELFATGPLFFLMV